MITIVFLRGPADSFEELLSHASSTHHGDCYFSHGDVLIKIQSSNSDARFVDFKLYRDILTRHSTYLRDLMNNPEEKTIRHSQDSSILKANQVFNSGPDDFRTLCRIMYPDPSNLGVFPHAEPGRANTWQSTILATSEFEMASIRAYILAQLAQDEAIFSEVPALLLGRAKDLKELEFEDYRELMAKCYRTYAFLRSPPSYSDLKNHSFEAHNIMIVREGVRNLFVERQTFHLWLSTSSPTSCAEPTTCQDSLVGALAHNVADPSPNPDRSTNIFEPLNTNGISETCRSLDLLGPVKQRLNLEVDRFLEELDSASRAPPPSISLLVHSRRT